MAALCSTVSDLLGRSEQLTLAFFYSKNVASAICRASMTDAGFSG
jgi:hypothetical protein